MTRRDWLDDVFGRLSEVDVLRAALADALHRYVDATRTPPGVPDAAAPQADTQEPPAATTPTTGRSST